MENHIQIPLFAQREYQNVIPMAMYDKFYSLFAFNEIKYHKLLLRVIRRYKLNGVYDLTYLQRKKLKEKCYVLDEFNQKKSLGDQRHIFRYTALHSILEKIYLTHSYNFDKRNEKPFNWDGLVFYPDEQQAELKDFQNADLKTRIIIHIALLRLLKTYECSISESISIINIMLLLLLKSNNACFYKV